MNSEQINSELVINEWQLGQQLNLAVHNGTREKFNLLLSLLSDDAQDFAQFSLSSEKQAASVSNDLRNEFHLGQAQPLVNKGMPLQQAKLYNSDIQQQDLASIRLRLLVNNEPLLSRAQQSDLPTDIIDNLSLLSQQRLAFETKQKATAVIDNGAIGINNELMEAYKSLDIENKPLKVTYM